MKKTKNFVLISGNEEGWYLGIDVSVNRNGTFKNKSKFQFQNYNDKHPYSSKEKKRISDYHKKYYLTHREHILECTKNYKKSKKGKEVEKQAASKYRKTEKGKEAMKKGYKKYSESEMGKQHISNASKRYSKTKKGKEAQHRKDAKRRNLDFIELNEEFEGSEAHHIDREFILYISKELHRSVWHNVWNGKGMEEINGLAFEFVYGVDLCNNVLGES